MLASSCATVLYLWRHMKNMEKSGLVSPRLQRQIKMTITGITVQVLLHFLCSDGIIIVVIAERFSRNNWDSDGFILCTIISLYSFGTTINMGVCHFHWVHLLVATLLFILANMFYFCQIVPLQHSVFMWIKRNIKAFIYSALILNGIFYLFGMIEDVAYETVGVNYDLAFNAPDDETLQIQILLMLASSYATVVYLRRHMKHVEESGLVSPRLQRQIKMTITGITVQALLHFLFSFWIITLGSLNYEFPEVDVDWSGHIICPIISLYSFGTSIYIGVSHTLFQQRLVQAGQKRLQMFNLLFD
uniref:Taste receptor type 2 n=1 Tax=Pygocentrus nattereri TaxID=42514 RepID=A0AAR2KXE8_PYGNA